MGCELSRPEVGDVFCLLLTCSLKVAVWLCRAKGLGWKHPINCVGTSKFKMNRNTKQP
jgi:hypothetical protein